MIAWLTTVYSTVSSAVKQNGKKNSLNVNQTKLASYTLQKSLDYSMIRSKNLQKELKHGVKAVNGHTENANRVHSCWTS